MSLCRGESLNKGVDVLESKENLLRSYMAIVGVKKLLTAPEGCLIERPIDLNVLDTGVEQAQSHIVLACLACTYFDFDSVRLCMQAPARLNHACSYPLLVCRRFTFSQKFTTSSSGYCTNLFAKCFLLWACYGSALQKTGSFLSRSRLTV